MFKTYEMARIHKEQIDMPFELWIDSAGELRNTKHNDLRVKAYNNDTWITVGFDNGIFTTFKTTNEAIKKFGEITKLEKYITYIQPLLELHWEGKIFDNELINILEYINKNIKVPLIENINNALNSGVLKREQAITNINNKIKIV